MANKKHLVFGTLIMGMAFAAVLAGCASAGSTKAEAPAAGAGVENPAAQLAANLNAIEAGSAAAEGATVKLTGGFVWLQSDLTVPAGVTLDVTAKDTALGLGDITLTVDGTVLAGPDHVRLEDQAGAAVINGSGTIRLQSKGSLLRVEGNKNVANRKLTLNGVTLVGLKDNDNSLVQVNEGGTFVLKSGAITGNTTQAEYREGNGGGVAVWGGTFTMEGGEISGNTARTGGGVLDVGTFTMTGGVISGNSAAQHGGGVAGTANRFTMTGGAITGNTAGKDCGGVLLFNENGVGGTFTMEGGAIYGNTAANGGAGVTLWRSTFTMNGGRIQGSTDSDGFTKNTAADPTAALIAYNSTAKWGTGGAYTKGGVPQRGGSDIGQTDDTLIATPAK